jgi:hypothetical protein
MAEELSGAHSPAARRASALAWSAKQTLAEGFALPAQTAREVRQREGLQLPAHLELLRLRYDALCAELESDAGGVWANEPVLGWGGDPMGAGGPSVLGVASGGAATAASPRLFHRQTLPASDHR